MASRMKRMFHRKKDDDSEEPIQRERTPAAAKSNPAIRTSLYESTTAGGLPQNGDYPIKGNDSSVILQADRKSSVHSLRSWRSSSRGSPSAAPLQAPTSTQYDGSRSNPRLPPQTSNASDTKFYDAYQSPTRGQDDPPKRWSRSPLPQEFANLSIGDSQSPTTTTQTVTTTRTGRQGQFGNRVAPQTQTQTQTNPNQNQSTKVRVPHTNTHPQDPSLNRNYGQTEGYGTRGNDNPGAIDQLDGQRPSANESYQGYVPSTSTSNVHSTPGDYGEYDAGLARQKSIPRKQVGTTAQAPYSSTMPFNGPTTQNSHSRQQSAPKALPATPISSNNGSGGRVTERTSESSGILDRSRPITRGMAESRNAHDVVNRAKTNTYDTEVIEKVAPAVVHENITKDVHHVREEVITREIHTHDVYHRILPVVDVEVLPPRHFLPVEGGGLVEVSAAEVPGRGNNWVIAETASKIPSDQAAPRGPSMFTARQFPGQEGDAVRHVTSEGLEKTEQTWVHPPELEQGARLTGQSWPMVFGDDTAQKEPLDYSTPKSTQRKSPKKGHAIQANPAHRADRLGRSA